MFFFQGGFGAPVVAAGVFIRSRTPLALAQGSEQQISITLSNHTKGSEERYLLGQNTTCKFSG